MKPRSRQSSYFLTLSLLILLKSSLYGCIIRTSHADHYLGPVILVQGSADVSAGTSEQIHFPAVIEMGTQWGISIGLIKRVVGSPDEVTSSNDAGHPQNRILVSTFMGFPLTSNALISLLYLRAEQEALPEFRMRSLIGGRIGFGAEYRSASIGVVHTTEFVPLKEGLYFLCYRSNQPEALRFIFARNLERVSTLNCDSEIPI
jgi:hypothetical protein